MLCIVFLCAVFFANADINFWICCHHSSFSLYSSIYNNGETGLIVFQLKNNGGAAVNIEDVRAMNNGIGIGASGTNVTIRNADAPNNAFAGLQIFRANGYDDQLTDITLDGHVSLNNNANYGFIGFVGNVVGTLKVPGNLITNGNKYDGFFLSGTTNSDLNVVLDDGSSSGKSGKTSSSGSITSCNNGQTVDDPDRDIVNFGDSTFEGTDYTCDNTGGTGDVPVCMPCYPNCVSTSEFNRVRNLMPGDEYEMMDIYPSVHYI